MPSLTTTFYAPSDPWSTNEDRNLNKYARAERILEWKSAASLGWASYCNGRGLSRGVGDALIRVDIPFRTKRRRDPHNYCGTVVKAIIDGYVLAGAWPDDTGEYVEHLAPTLSVRGDGVVGVQLFSRAELYLPCIHGSRGSCSEVGCEGAEEVVI